MNTFRILQQNFSKLLLALAVFPLLLSACQAANVSPIQLVDQPEEQPPEATLAEQLPAASLAAQPDQTLSGEIAFDLSGVAQGWITEKVEAVSPGADQPWWDVLPEHHRVTLQGYPISEHLLQPQILVYPAAELILYNETAGRTAADLQTLLQTRQPGEMLPFLPLYNAAQVMHAGVQFVEFKNGSGVRYLTQYDQGILPINSYELIYTFQGLTSDGQYYVAAVMPLMHPELPATQQVDPQAEYLKDFTAYLAETAAWLDQQPGESFTPDLAKLDALVQSIEIK